MAETKKDAQDKFHRISRSRRHDERAEQQRERKNTMFHLIFLERGLWVPSMRTSRPALQGQAVTAPFIY